MRSALPLGVVVLFAGCSAFFVGCSDSGSSRTGGFAAAASAAAIATGSLSGTAFQPVRAPADQVSELTLTLSRPVEPTTVVLGTTLRVFRDVDRNPGGAFSEIQGAISFRDADSTIAFAPSQAFLPQREVRLVLTRDVATPDGTRLERGGASSPLTFSTTVPDGVFEGRFFPESPQTSGQAPSSQAPSSQAPSSQTPVGQPPVGLTPGSFQVQQGTDKWRLDFEKRRAEFSLDLDRRGLRSGDAATDRLVKERVVARVLSVVSQKYRRTADGKAIAGRSWKISFTSANPGGQVKRDYSRIAVGGKSSRSARILGEARFDRDNRNKEDNSGRFGVFSRVIYGVRSDLRPAMRGADKRYVDGTYRLGSGGGAADARFQQIRAALDDWGHAVGAVTTHEVGHSVGLLHYNTDPIGIMRSAAPHPLLSDTNSHFATEARGVLNRNLGKH